MSDTILVTLQMKTKTRGVRLTRVPCIGECIRIPPETLRVTNVIHVPIGVLAGSTEHKALVFVEEVK